MGGDREARVCTEWMEVYCVCSDESNYSDRSTELSFGAYLYIDLLLHLGDFCLSPPAFHSGVLHRGESGNVHDG